VFDVLHVLLLHEYCNTTELLRTCMIFFGLLGDLYTAGTDPEFRLEYFVPN